MTASLAFAYNSAKATELAKPSIPAPWLRSRSAATLSSPFASLASIPAQGAVQRQTQPEAVPIYDDSDLTIPVPAALSLADALELIQKEKDQKRLSEAKVAGFKAGTLEEAMLYYILAYVSRHDGLGKERDLIVPIGLTPKGSGVAPVGKVTVSIDSAGKGTAVLLSRGGVAPPKNCGTLDACVAILKSTYGIADVKDGTARWEPKHLSLVIGAFSRLPPGDVGVLKGMVLERVKEIAPKNPKPGTEGTVAGEYLSGGGVSGTVATEISTLKLTDKAFAQDPVQFVGSAGKEAPSSYFTILHEVGHVVEEHTRNKARQAVNMAKASRNAIVIPYNAATAAEQKTMQAKLDAATNLRAQFSCQALGYGRARRCFNGTTAEIQGLCRKS